MNRSYKSPRHFLAILLACIAAFWGVPRFHAQTPTTLESIAKAWKARQDRARTARIAWTERKTITKGFLTTHISEARILERLRIPQGSIVPPEDVTFPVPVSLVLDEDKVRYDRVDREWSARESSYVPQPRLVTLDGTTVTSLDPKGAPSGPWPQAVIKQGYSPDIRSVFLLPVLLTLRASAGELRLFDPETVSLTGRQATIEGRSCWELQHQTGTFVQRIWVDAQRDHVVVRVIHTSQGQLSLKVDTHYRQHPACGWVPDSWDIVTYFPNGKLETSRRATVTSCDINPKVDLAEFNIEFSPGTVVIDLSDPNNEVKYILREGGKKRWIAPEEHGLTYEQLLNSDTRDALGGKGRSFLSYSVVISLLLAAGIAGLLLWKRRVFPKASP